MTAYPNEWRWNNGIQQERTRMLIPLAWLVRVEDSPEHRDWLEFRRTSYSAFKMNRVQFVKKWVSKIGDLTDRLLRTDNTEPLKLP